MNPSLTSLVNDVYALTNRPDLVGETLIAIRNATLKAHRTDFYAKDIFETGIECDYPNIEQTLDYKGFIPRWRAPKYIRKYANGLAGAMLELITTEQIFDSYSITRNDVFYVAGTQLKIRCSEAQQYFLVGCYVYPDVTEDSYNSWIAQEHPSAIVYEACAVIFKTIGFDEQRATYADMVKEEYRQLLISNV